MTLIDFTLSKARRFYSSMGNRLAVKGSTTSNTMSPLSTLLFSVCLLVRRQPQESQVTQFTIKPLPIATVRLIYEQCLYDFKPTHCISILYE